MVWGPILIWMLSLSQVLAVHVSRAVDDSHYGEECHVMEINDLADRYNTDLTSGLTMSAASQLMDTYGSNIVPSPQPCPPWMCCLLPWLKNTATMQSYRRCVPDSAQITRGGRNLCIDASSVVPGDIVYVETGDTVPADCRVIACSEGLSVCPFDLEGVVLYVSGATGSRKVSFIDAENMLYAGSVVLHGTSRALVVSIGASTVFGNLIRHGFWPPALQIDLSETSSLLPI